MGENAIFKAGTKVYKYNLKTFEVEEMEVGQIDLMDYTKKSTLPVILPENGIFVFDRDGLYFNSNF